MAKKVFPVVLRSAQTPMAVARRRLPKQFLPRVTDRSILQDSIQRSKIVGRLRKFDVISSNAHRLLVAEQTNELGTPPAVPTLKPMDRNTASPVAIAAPNVA